MIETCQKRVVVGRPDRLEVDKKADTLRIRSRIGHDPSARGTRQHSAGRAGRYARRRSVRQWCIQIMLRPKMTALRTYIPDTHNVVAAEIVLDAEVVLHHIRCVLRLIPVTLRD